MLFRSLGVDEYKRLGAPLETNWFSVKGLFNEQQFFGRDIPRFIQELEATKMSINSVRNAGLQKLRKIDPQAASLFTGEEEQQQKPTQPSGPVRIRFSTEGKKIK